MLGQLSVRHQSFYTSGLIVQPSVLLFTGLDIKVRKARVFQGASAVNA